VTFLGTRKDSDGFSQEAAQGPGSRSGSLREKGFGDDFVMDISEVNNDGEEGEEADIPF
jgi:hypothetical protein